MRTPDHAAPGDGADAAGGRLAWADVAKGGCILLVLLWHVIMKDYLQFDWRLDLPVAGAWGTLGELLPMRMPLFFTISGMFAAHAVRRPWRSVGRPRIARFLYLYGVWLLIHTAVLALAPDFPTDRATSPGELLAQLTVTPSNLWYLSALALYFVLAKALRRVHPAVLLGAAGAAGRPRPPDAADLRDPHAGAGAAAPADRRAGRRPGRHRPARVGLRLPVLAHRPGVGAQPRPAPGAAGGPRDVALRPARGRAAPIDSTRRRHVPHRSSRA
ncbi:acyltransferase [Micromonospora sp. WMMD1082]|uniref:acyltransferase family protein n=1 Tax=Micromonospora sp. WMMD1082 TaxID=3016104 RepID=UPI002417D2F5|nr:acyltransferase [Micromonospora sp. WMMD1082]MDG4793191.1 acyltransferase [Micromonospora sp. WMMD1082]